MRIPLGLLSIGCMVATSIVAPQAGLAQDNAEGWLAVSFFTGSAYSKDGDRVRLQSGSVWEVENLSLLLVPTDVSIIRPAGRTDQCGLMVTKYFQGSACRVSGYDTEQRGHLTTVVRAMGGGAVLETSDGSLWEVPDYDQYDSGYWLPPYEVVVTSNELYMHNIEEGKRIWVTRAR